MLKLKGQTETGEGVEFEASSICRADKLKPCPFCGSEVFLLDVATRSDADAKWDVYCRTHECFLNSGTNNMFSNREDAMIAWNTRSDAYEIIALREQVKVLREALEGLLSMVPDNQAIYNHMILQKQIALAALSQTKPKDGD